MNNPNRCTHCLLKVKPGHRAQSKKVIGICTAVDDEVSGSQCDNEEYGTLGEMGNGGKDNILWR